MCYFFLQNMFSMHAHYLDPIQVIQIVIDVPKIGNELK